MHPTIPPGAVLLTYAQARARLGHEGKSTFHDRLKRDPTFPRPVYLSEREPRIFEHELDRWMADLAASRDEKSALARRQLKNQEADHAPA